jgi:enolase-phosphatase E1
MHYRVVLLDVEGTTTRISFVHDVLFGYARKHLEAYVEDNWSSPSMKETVSSVNKQLAEDGAASISDQQGLCRTLLGWMDLDRKVAPLKDLQGLIWRSGFESGELKGHVFEDVPRAFRAWRRQGVSIYIYSSGSVEAQKLLFAHSTHGDLSRMLAGHFDTKIGGKRDPSSYSRILEEIGVNEVLFVSDRPEELSAARSAGLSVCLAERPGNEAVPLEPRWPRTHSLCDLVAPQRTSTRKRKAQK